MSDERVPLEPGEATDVREPTNFVAAVLDDRAAFDAALQDLTANGFAASAVEIRYGQAGVDAFTSRPRNWFGELLSDAADYERRFVEDLREGHFAIRVRVDGDGERDLARDSLRRHGGHHVVSAGRWSFETDPDYPPVRK